jgi:hypothetical protein
VEVYSIDETFLDLSGFGHEDLWDHAQDMRATVRRWTGIPTCVGLGPTKTLAKLANAVAKRNPTFGGVCDLTHPAVRGAVLRAFAVEDVWGVGAATARKLAGLGVATAANLRDLDAALARRVGTVVLERVVRELRGFACLGLEQVPPTRKGLAVTRSFGRPVSDLGGVLEAVATYATRAGEKLRAHGLVAGQLTAFLHTNPHSRVPATTARAPPAGADDGRHRELVAAAARCVEAAWKDGFAYAKAGVVLDDLRRREDAPAHPVRGRGPPRGGAHARGGRAERQVWAARRLPGGDGHPALLEAAGRALLAALHHPAQRPAGAAGVAAGREIGLDRGRDVPDDGRMCGRFLLHAPVDVLQRAFGFAERPNLRPRYNVAPTRRCRSCAARTTTGRELAPVRWGLIPSWAKDASIGSSCINARAETVAEKPPSGARSASAGRWSRRTGSTSGESARVAGSSSRC